MEREVAIQAIHLAKSFHLDRPIIRDLNVSIFKGEIHGLVGPNGAGKSTTLRLFAGLMGKSSGELLRNGEVQFVPDLPALYEKLTVREALQVTVDLVGKKSLSVEESIALMELEEFEHLLIEVLSKGQRQRVSLAQALIPRPQILILDEPTNGLDPFTLIHVKETLKKLAADNCTVVLSSHLLSEIEELCTAITVLEKGSVAYTGPLEGFTKGHRQVGIVGDQRLMLAKVKGLSLNDFSSAFPHICYTAKSYDENSSEKEFEFLVDGHEIPVLARWLALHAELHAWGQKEKHLEEGFKQWFSPSIKKN